MRLGHLGWITIIPKIIKNAQYYAIEVNSNYVKVLFIGRSFDIMIFEIAKFLKVGRKVFNRA